LGIVAQYYSKQAQVLYAAGQAVIDLQQELLADIKDGVISHEELTGIIAKVEAAKAALLAVVNLFSQPTTLGQKFEILTGAAEEKIQIASLQLKAERMAAKRLP
jgi:hypothetical protein